MKKIYNRRKEEKIPLWGREYLNENIKKSFLERFFFQEYQHLSAETRETRKFISNAVWIAYTGYATTIAGAALFQDNLEKPFNEPELAGFTIVLLSFQSLIISIMWLYQIYTMSKIFGFLFSVLSTAPWAKAVRGPLPYSWEIADIRKKSSLFYIIIFIALQSPIIIMMFVTFWHWFGDEYLFLSSRKNSSVYEIGGSITENVIVLSVFILIICLDWIFSLIYIKKIYGIYASCKKLYNKIEAQ